MENYFTLFAVAAMVISLIGCNSNENARVFQMTDSSDERLPNDLEEIIEFSDVVVRGSFKEFIKEVNMIRSTNDPTVPSEEFYTEGHVYDFQIEEVYKGDVTDTLKTLITYADKIPVIDDDGEIVGEVMVQSIDYEEMSLDTDYILFLVDSSFIEEGFYTPAAGAYIIEIDDDESLRFLTQRMVGQLHEELEVEETSDVISGVLISEFRDEISVDVTQEFSIFKNYLEDEEIEDLSDIEEILEK